MKQLQQSLPVRRANAMSQPKEKELKERQERIKRARNQHAKFVKVKEQKDALKKKEFALSNYFINALNFLERRLVYEV